MSEAKTEKMNAMEMFSFGAAQFATSIFVAFSAYYLMMFCTDVALIPPAMTAVLLFCYRLFSALDDQAVGLFINRVRFKDGKYRPYFKWCALPFAISLAALPLIPGIIYVAFILIICDLCRSALYTASMSMLPYLAKDDVNRTKFVSFSNAGSILSFIAVGTFMLPLSDYFGGGDRNKGFALVLAVYALVSILLHFNAYFRLKEWHYVDPIDKPAIKDMFMAMGRSKRIMLFFVGYGLYSMADAFKSMTTYYYVTYNMEKPDLLPVVILAGLITPLAVQPIIPRLLAYAKKESLIIFALFASSCVSLLMLAAGNQSFAMISCVVLYGLFTAIVANLVFTVMASFSDEIQLGQNMSMSEILAASLSLSSSLGTIIASGAAPLTMAAYGYSAQAAVQTDSALAGIKALYILCTATGLALSGVVLLFFSKK